MFLSGCCSFLPCDPGWHYKAVDGAPVPGKGLRYAVTTSAGLTVRVAASVFTGTLTTDLEVTNDADEAFSVRPDALRALDSRGTNLIRSEHSHSLRCDGQSDAAETQLPKGGACRVRADWQVRPDLEVLKEVRLVFDGAVRGTQNCSIQVLLRAD